MLPTTERELLLDLGFVVVSGNYRLCPTISLLEGPVADSYDLYEWARAQLPGLLKSDLGIQVDGSNIVTWGHSCGGLLALLQGGRAPPPKAIVDFFGYKYLRDSFFHSPSDALAKIPDFPDDFLAKVKEEVPAPSATPPPMGPSGPNYSNPRNAWLFSSMKDGTGFSKMVGDGNLDDADPVKLFKKGFPPTFFLHGTADTVVDVKFSKAAHEDLKKAGVKTDIRIVEGGAHAFNAHLERGEEGFKVIEDAFNFLAESI